MKFTNLLIGLLLTKEGSSFILSRSQPTFKTRIAIVPTITSLVVKKNYGKTSIQGLHKLPASTSSGVVGDTNEENGRTIPLSIAVGSITAAMGFVYGKALSLCVKTVWKTVPSLVLKRMGSINPAYFITGACTAGRSFRGNRRRTGCRRRSGTPA